LEAESTKATVLFVGPTFPELKTLEKEVTQIELELPKETEIEDSIELQLENLRSNGLDISLNKETQDALQQSLLGLTAVEISNVVAKAVISCNGLNQDSINVILEEKEKRHTRKWFTYLRSSRTREQSWRLSVA